MSMTSALLVLRHLVTVPLPCTHVWLPYWAALFKASPKIQVDGKIQFKAMVLPWMKNQLIIISSWSWFIMLRRQFGSVAKYASSA